MLILLQSLSSAPSSHPQEEEAPPRGTSSESTHPHERAGPPSGTSNALLQSSGPIPTTAPQYAPIEENLNGVKASRSISVLKRLLPARIRKSNNKSLHEPNRVPSKSRQATDQSRPHPPVRVEDSSAGPSTMAAARPKRVRAPLIDDRMCYDQHIILESGCDIFQSAIASKFVRRNSSNITA